MNYSNKQEAKVALVTGGAKRIGAGIVNALHEAGYRVCIHCHHSVDDANTLAETLNAKRPGSAMVVIGALERDETASQIILQTIGFASRLDLLINNASVFLRTNPSASKSTQDTWQMLFDTNVKAPFLLSMAAKPWLQQSQGSIINITDIHAATPLKDYSVYCQTKAALLMQTKSLALEFAPDIRVNAIAPGAVAWPEGDNELSSNLQEKIIERTPLKCHGSPLHIAMMVVALAQNPFVTGQNICVDGGRSIRS